MAQELSKALVVLDNALELGHRGELLNLDNDNGCVSHYSLIPHFGLTLYLGSLSLRKEPGTEQLICCVVTRRICSGVSIWLLGIMKPLMV